MGARADKLVLASVKSYFGSRGVVAEHVTGDLTTGAAGNRGYAMLNDPVVTGALLAGARETYGYRDSQIEFRLYVGRFAPRKSGDNETLVREWCARQTIGAGPIGVYNVQQVAEVARAVAAKKMYRDNPALVAIKVLQAAQMLTPIQQRGAADLEPLTANAETTSASATATI